MRKNGDILVGIIGEFILNAMNVNAGVTGLNPISLFTAFVGAVVYLDILCVIR